MRKRVTICLTMAVACALTTLVGPVRVAADSLAPVKPHVLVVVAFADNGSGAPSEEAAPWVVREHLDRPTRTKNGTLLRCNATRTICLLISGVGKVNAATSLLSLGYDSDVDLRQTYVIVSGIAGVSPESATIGSSAWASWIVDYDLAHEIDGRELPPGFTDSRFQQGCMHVEWCGTAGWREGTEVFRLDPKAVRFAYTLTKNVELENPPVLARIRNHYPQVAARQGPHVTTCDILAGDTYWVGTRFGRFADAWTKHWTHGAGTYCMSAMEDAAYAGSIAKLATTGRVDARRFFELRSGSDFDRQYPRESAIGALRAGIGGHTFVIAEENGYRTARVLVRYLDSHWSTVESARPY